MSTAEKLFSFQGRLRRRDWWALLLALIVINLVLTAIGMVMLGSSVMPFTMGSAGASFDRSDWMTKRQEVQIVVSLITLWPILAIGTKRLHDRGRPGWWVALICGLSLAYQALRLSYDLSLIASRPTLALLILGLANVSVGLWLLIEMGSLDGTPGPNKYGPSPKGLDETASTAVLDAGGT